MEDVAERSKRQIGVIVADLEHYCHRKQYCSDVELILILAQAEWICIQVRIRIKIPLLKNKYKTVL